MGRSLGIAQLLTKVYASMKIAAEWLAAVGEISEPFTWLIFGKPKNGKTTFVLKFCRMVIEQGYKVYYNSMEEGDSKTFVNALRNAGFTKQHAGKFILGDRDTFTEMCDKLKKNKAKVVVIDSRDYMKLTTDQWKRLTVMFPRKCFILICWEQSGKPLGKYAKDIEFMVSMVTHVSRFTATTNGRFGSNLKYTIWDKGQVGGLFDIPAPVEVNNEVKATAQ
jgi:predicted ATP-dependent serine protease